MISNSPEKEQKEQEDDKEKLAASKNRWLNVPQEGCGVEDRKPLSQK